MTPILLLLALAQGPGDEPENLRWPLGPGDVPYSLLTTYGQIVGGESGVQAGDQLHRGIDVIAKSTPEAVKSLEAGKVVKVEDSDPYRSSILVASTGVPGRAFLYLHLDQGSIQVAKGNLVTAGQWLADVVRDDPITGVPHLHLARIGKNSSNRWTAKDRWCVRNPLALIDREYMGDTVAPEFQRMNGEHVTVRSDELTWSSPYSKPLGAIPSGRNDVLVRLFDLDRTGASYPLAPYRIRLSIETPGGVLEGSHEILLDRPIGTLAAENVYNRTDAFKSVGSVLPPDYDYYFVASNGGSAPATTNYWDAASGDHVLKIEASDVAGNTASISRAVTVK